MITELDYDAFVRRKYLTRTGRRLPPSLCRALRLYQFLPEPWQRRVFGITAVWAALEHPEVAARIQSFGDDTHDVCITALRAGYTRFALLDRRSQSRRSSEIVSGSLATEMVLARLRTKKGNRRQADYRDILQMALSAVRYVCDLAHFADVSGNIGRSLEIVSGLPRLIPGMKATELGTAGWSPTVHAVARAVRGVGWEAKAEWRTSTVVALAEQAWADDDPGILPILADALEDAGCDADLTVFRAGLVPRARVLFALQDILARPVSPRQFPPETPICGARRGFDGSGRCTLPANHEGLHRTG